MPAPPSYRLTILICSTFSCPEVDVDKPGISPPVLPVPVHVIFQTIVWVEVIGWS
jgi:hypothetical protein